MDNHKDRFPLRWTILISRNPLAVTWEEYASESQRAQSPQWDSLCSRSAFNSLVYNTERFCINYRYA
jgi:hypothetical protein